MQNPNQKGDAIVLLDREAKYLYPPFAQVSSRWVQEARGSRARPHIDIQLAHLVSSPRVRKAGCGSLQLPSRNVLGHSAA